MIKEYKKNETQYIKKCKCCKSKFIYENEDYYNEYNYGRKHIKCPYCKEVNKIRFKIIFKNDEQVKDDIKKEYDELKKKYNNLQNLKIENENNFHKENIKLQNKYYEKENKIKNYINDYMSSDKKSNIAIKHLKAILELLEELR